LHDLADEHPGRLEIESLDITELDQITALHDHLSGRSFDIAMIGLSRRTRADHSR
jgi:hypothetical protein